MTGFTSLTHERLVDRIGMAHTPGLGIYGVAFVERHTYGVHRPVPTQSLY